MNNEILDTEFNDALDFLFEFCPKEVSKSENGTIILDSSNESDSDWYYDR